MTRRRPGRRIEIWFVNVSSAEVRKKGPFHGRLWDDVDTVELEIRLETGDESPRFYLWGAEEVNAFDDLGKARKRVLEVARELAAPFGIQVRADVDVGEPLLKVALNPGQRAWELIEELCRYRALLPVSDGRGGLVLTRAGRARAGVPFLRR